MPLDAPQSPDQKRSSAKLPASCPDLAARGLKAIVRLRASRSDDSFALGETTRSPREEIQRRSLLAFAKQSPYRIGGI